jgi:hypothetical protein
VRDKWSGLRTRADARLGSNRPPDNESPARAGLSPNGAALIFAVLRGAQIANCKLNGLGGPNDSLKVRRFGLALQTAVSSFAAS